MAGTVRIGRYVVPDLGLRAGVDRCRFGSVAVTRCCQPGARPVGADVGGVLALCHSLTAANSKADRLGSRVADGHREATRSALDAGRSAWTIGGGGMAARSWGWGVERWHGGCRAGLYWRLFLGACTLQER